MKFVARTFTRISDSDGTRPDRVEGLDALRDGQAYVLLGSPGSGKSTVFRQEAKRTGACFVTARNFIRLTRNEWRTNTLFIDGLDEMRVGSADPRVPLDQVITRLSQFDRPRFRISCRNAEWLGSNDRKSLEELTDGGDVPVLRLDPLGMQDIRDILGGWLGSDASEQFLDGAIERGLQGLLGNPLTLELLAEAFSHSEWPRNRTDAFSLACEKLAAESNDEHLIATERVVNAAAVRRVAGQLCAFLLLTGKTGYSLVGSSTDQDSLAPGELGEVDSSVLKQVLGSRLFESPRVSTRLVPIHRHVAEFVAARYLARLVREGLPVRRLLSLVCGYDGLVVSEFSGVTAWLAALCKSSRFEIIDRDPLGTLLHGDVSEFSSEEKRALIQCIAKRNWRHDDYYRLIATGDTAVEDLATPDMSSVLRSYLRDPANDDESLRATLLVVRSLQSRSGVSGLRSDLLQVVRNDQWHPQIRFHALRAFCKQSVAEDRDMTDLTGLLDEVANGDVHDEDDELLGLLLDTLYPSILQASDTVRFLKVPKKINLYGTYKRFWFGLSDREMTTEKIGEVLDSLYNEMPLIRARFKGHEMDREILSKLPGLLLARYLNETTQVRNHLHLYNWVELVFNLGSLTRRQHTENTRNWLSSHPEDFRAIVENGIKRCAETKQTEAFVQRFRRIFDNLDCPSKLVGWVREQSLIVDNSTIKRVLRQLSERGIEAGDPSDMDNGQQIDSKDQDTDSVELVKELGLERPIGSEPPALEIAEEDQIEPWHEEWRSVVRGNLEAIGAGRCEPSILNGLAQAYFGVGTLRDSETPTERLRRLLGDESLVNAALGGLRGAVHRSDVPTPDEIAAFVKDDSIHILAHPFLAGIAEIEHARERVEDLLDERRLRVALAFYFATPFVDPQPYRTSQGSGALQDLPLWYQRLLQSEPGLVAEVLVKMVRAEISKGLVLFDLLLRLETSPDHADVAQLACIPLLRSIPVRSNRTQMDGLACLLRAAILHCDQDALLSLIDKKLRSSTMHAGQRVYWLTAVLFVSSATYREELVESLSKSEMLISRVIDFAVGSSPLPRWEPPLDRLDTQSLECLIQFGGKLHNPLHSGTLRIEGPIFVDLLIKRLSEDPSEQASFSLSKLSQSPDLERWRQGIQKGQIQQAEIRRSVSFRYVRTRQLHRTLYNWQPTSAADLAALTADRLGAIALRIRHGNTSGWRQYWDFRNGKCPAKPRHEELCRDSLLSDLRLELRDLEIDAQPEGYYADDKRADIRVSHLGFNVPIEIKKSNQSVLWSSVRDQLVRKYTRDPSCDGYGIYVVLWFGPEKAKTSPSGTRPRSARELKDALEATLSAPERLKLSVVVVDVAMPRY